MTFQKMNKPHNANDVQPDDPAPNKPASSSARPSQEPPLDDVGSGSASDIATQSHPAVSDTEQHQSGERRSSSPQRS